MAMRDSGDVPIHWPEEGPSRVPYSVYSDPEIHRREVDRIFRGPLWHFLCLEIEIPEPGDWRTGWVGEIPVVVTRDLDGSVHALVNRCAHKGALVCLEERGHGRQLTCIYHAWSYDLRGNLKGLAFRNGVNGRGGMPEDFDISARRLEPLRVESFCGLVFGTFQADTPPLEDYLGERMAGFIRRNFGRPLKVIGRHSQILHNNWKLYAENIRDSYHATVLHTFYTTFKVNRLDMDGGIVMSEDGRHHVSYAKRATLKEAAEYREADVHSIRYDSQLAAPELLAAWDEFDDGITHSIQSVFPTLGLQNTLNSLAVRFFRPLGPDKMEIDWIYLGAEDDSADEADMRTLQANLTGAAGFVSLEDGCINEFVQRGTAGSAEAAAFMEMGGREIESSENSRATETAIRGFWRGYREVMELE